MNYLALTIGSIAILLGLALIILTAVFLREERWKNILMGIVFILLGLPILVTGIQGKNSIPLNIGITDRQIVIILTCIVFGLFIVKGVLDIRTSFKALNENAITSAQVYKARFRIIVSLVLITFSLILWIVTFVQLGR
jgi:hypothetical protein